MQEGASQAGGFTEVGLLAHTKPRDSSLEMTKDSSLDATYLAQMTRTSSHHLRNLGCAFTITCKEPSHTDHTLGLLSQTETNVPLDQPSDSEAAANSLLDRPTSRRERASSYSTQPWMGGTRRSEPGANG